MKILRPFAILIVFVLLCTVHLSIYTNSIKTGYEIDGLRSKLEKIRSDNRYLSYIVAKEEALPRIEQIARQKLKMVYPEKINYIIVPTSEGAGKD